MRVELKRTFHLRGATYVLIYALLLNLDLQMPPSMLSRSHLRLNANNLVKETHEWIAVARCWTADAIYRESHHIQPEKLHWGRIVYVKSPILIVWER